MQSNIENTEAEILPRVVGVHFRQFGPSHPAQWVTDQQRTLARKLVQLGGRDFGDGIVAIPLVTPTGETILLTQVEGDHDGGSSTLVVDCYSNDVNG